MTLHPATPHDRRRPELPSLPVLTRARARGLDLVVLGGVPLVLVGLFHLPASVKHALVLSYAQPTLLSAYASHYVHLSAGHLAANLAGYLALAPLGYLLCLASGRRRAFFVAFVSFLLVVPFALSLLNVLLYRPRVGYGFSGVVMAFLGFLPLALFWHLETSVDERLDVTHSPLLYFGGLGVIAAWAVPPTTVSVASAVAATVVAAVYLRSIHHDLSPPLAGSRGRPAGAGHLELLVVGVIVFAGFPLAAFPPGPTGPGTVLNLYSHLLGYSLGYTASFVTFGVVGVDADS